METEKPDNKSPQVPWAGMHEIPLQRIYSFLGRKDQVNMSLVCNNWYEQYKSPAAWKNFTFHLKNRHLSKTPCPVLTYAVEKHSNKFKHVKIIYDIFTSDSLRDVWFNRFTELLEILTTTSELISIEFEGLDSFLRSTDRPTYCNICRVMGDFLESQRKLQRAEIFGPLFRFPDGVELLRKLMRSNSESLRHLGLRKFVKYNIEDHKKTSFEPNLLTLSDLPNLTTLDTDYSLIFINMVLQSVENQNTPALTKITLVYNDQLIQDMFGIFQSTDLRGLNLTDWQFLRTRSPGLQVNLTFDYYSMTEQILDFFIVKKMPVTRLEYIYANRSVKLDTEKVFNHLCKCEVNDHLEYLYIKGLGDQDLVSPFSSFLPICPKLKSLKIGVDISKSVADLLEYWLNHTPEYLEEVIIDIREISNDEHLRMLQNLNSEYLPLLGSIGLEIWV